MASKSLISENPTDYQQTYTPEQVMTALAQSGLAPADQQRVATSFQQVAQTISQATGTPSVSSVAPPSAPSQSAPKWVYAVNMATTYPDFASMKASGTGMVVDMDDPNAANLISNAKSWGVTVAVQVGAGNPGDMTPEQYAAKVQQAKSMGADTLVLDIEGAGKGVPGTPGWDWSQQAAAAIKPVVGNTTVVVTMEPHQDDYNYNAFSNVSSSGPTKFWVQSYQGDMTPVDPTWATASAKAAVGGDNVVAIFNPATRPPLSYTGDYVSFGVPSPDPSPGGPPPVGGHPAVPETSNVPYYPGQQPVTGAGSGQTPGPPIYVRPPGVTGTGGASPGPGVSSTAGAAAAAAAGGGAAANNTDWAAAYFASFGLPPDVAAKVNSIFKQYPDANEAIQFAMAYIRGTPWYQQTFPGIQYGMQHGLISDEQGYRQYVTSLDTLTQQYWGRHISGSEVSSYLFEGLTPEIVGRQYQGLANVMTNSKDYQYLLGGFSEEGQQSTDNLRALGNEQAGLDNPLGQKLARALQIAQTRLGKLFEGQAATPSLSLQNGLSAPSLLGSQQKPDVAA